MTQLVLVDGSNFYFKLRDLGLQHERFDFRAFSRWLSDSHDTLCRYYVGAVRQEANNPKSAQLYAKQQAFFGQLRRQGVDVSLGFIMRAAAYHEKGVDVKIAVDLLAGAYENLFERAFLVSSDTDLMPAIERAIAKGLPVEYVGFAHQPSYGLRRTCTTTRLLRRADLDPFRITAKKRQRK